MAKALPSHPAPASSGNSGVTGAVEHAMKLRCKSGDLALVIHDEEICHQNIGKLVRVAGPWATTVGLKKCVGSLSRSRLISGSASHARMGTNSGS